MPWNLFILPLIGGFWFSVVLNGLRFKTLQLPREHLFFQSATAAVLLLVVAKIVTSTLVAPLPKLVQWVERFGTPHLGTAICSMALGLVVPHLLNAAGEWFHRDKPPRTVRRLPDDVREKRIQSWKRRRRVSRWLSRFNLAWIEQLVFDRLIVSRALANERAIRKYGDQLERMLLDSTRDRMLMFSLRSGKVYVGWVNKHPANLDGRSPWLTISPFVSGYRADTHDHAIVFTTEYYQQQIARQQHGMDPLIKLLRVDEILDASYFDEDVWERFNN